MFAPSPLPRTLEASFRDLGSERATTRAAAIADLVRHARADAAARGRAVPLLERALAGPALDPSNAVRAAAALALADLAASEALASLLVAIEDEDGHVRQMALTALGEIADPRALPRLERALRDLRPEVRYQAIIAFVRAAAAGAGGAGDAPDAPAVVRALGAALDDADDEIRYIALRLAEEHRVGGDAARDLRERAASLLARAAGGHAHRVGRGEGSLAVVAALYLARIGDARGRPAVVDVVAGRRRTTVIEDERACVEIAGELGLREAIPDLEGRVWGSPGPASAGASLARLFAWTARAMGDGARCAWHARVALATMGHERARREIVQDLTSWRRETRAAAAVAAARSGIIPSTTG